MERFADWSMENYALRVPEKMIHDSGGKNIYISGTVLTVAANPNSINTINMDTLIKIPK